MFSKPIAFATLGFSAIILNILSIFPKSAPFKVSGEFCINFKKEDTSFGRKSSSITVSFTTLVCG